MALKDFNSVFSRYFVVGFFLPSYFALVAIYELAPGIYRHAFQGLDRGPSLLVLGGAALLLGLLLTIVACVDEAVAAPPSAPPARAAQSPRNATDVSLEDRVALR
jgi:hypothetical protein